jgi:hypothetical protein
MEFLGRTMFATSRVLGKFSEPPESVRKFLGEPLLNVSLPSDLALSR